MHDPNPLTDITHADPEDCRLVARARAGESDALEELVRGGYRTALYLGLALGSLALGPVITHRGYSAGFSAGGAVGMVGALFAALLWARGAWWRRRAAVT